MAPLTFENRTLYLLLSFALGFLFIVSFGPGLTHAHGDWTYDVFRSVCHQHPDRSYTYAGYKMAVCSRCFGIYSTLFISWLSMPLIAYIGLKNRKWLIRILVGIILLNMADVLGNYLDIWTNNLNSRFVLGAAFGFSITLLLNQDFFKTKNIGTYG